MEKKDCFAYNNGCTRLTDTFCRFEECRFYKTVEELEAQKKETKEKLERSESLLKDWNKMLNELKKETRGYAILAEMNKTLEKMKGELSVPTYDEIIALMNK